MGGPGTGAANLPGGFGPWPALAATVSLGVTAVVSRVTVLPDRTHHPFPSAISATRTGYCISVPCGRHHSVGTPAVPSLVSTGEVYLGALPLLPSPGPQTLPLLCGSRCAVHSLGRGQHPLLTPIPQDRSPVVLPQQPQQFLTHSWIVSTSHKYMTISPFSCLKDRLQTKNILLPHCLSSYCPLSLSFSRKLIKLFTPAILPFSLEGQGGHCPPCR